MFRVADRPGMELRGTAVCRWLARTDCRRPAQHLARHLDWRAPCISAARRRNLKLIGILLIVFGVVALAAGGFSYTKREKVLDLGPLQASTETRKTVPIAPIAGLAAIAGGIALVVVGGKVRA